MHTATAAAPVEDSCTPAPPTPSLIPRVTRFCLLFLTLLLLQFSLLRAGLLFTNHTSAVDATRSQLAGAFLRGLRSIFATACYLLFPLIILAHLPRIGLDAGPRARRFFFLLLSLLILITTLALIGEYAFFREFQTRYNQLAFQYLDQPRIILGMIWYNYPVFRYLLICLAISLIVLLPAYLISRRLFRPPALSPQPLRTLISLTLLLPLLIIAMHGGLQVEPLRWGDAYRSTNDFSNQLGLNGIFCLVHSFADRYARRDSDLWLKSKIPLPEARAVARHLVVSPGEQLLDPDNRTVFRRSNPAIPVSVRLKPTTRPPNVVLVIMESFSARFCGAAGAPEDLTPNFSRIAAGGILFDHAFSGGIHTHQGIFCTMLGFPNLPGHEYLLEQELGKQAFSSLPTVFKSKGYHTLFLYNGNFAWDDIRGFFQKQGVDTFIGSSEFINPSRRDKVWGVADQDVFNRANLEFDKADRTGKPFFSVILTLSNHIPFDLPNPLPFPPTTNHGDLNTRLDALRYADWSIGRFIDQAKSLPYFQNTLFVFVGDHGFHVDPVLTETHLLFHHVPLLFYSPNLLPTPGTTIQTPAGQTNIAPTIVGLLGLSVPHSYWARNLFDTSFPDPNFVYFKGSGNTGANRALAFIHGDTLLQISSTGSPSLYHYSLYPPTITPLTNPPLTQQMHHQLTSYIKSAMSDLTQYQAGGELLESLPAK